MSVSKTDLVNCPNCGHSAYDHWTLKGGVWDDATKGQTPHLLMKHLDIKDGGWVLSVGEYASNCHPGTLEGHDGCFKAIGEYFTPNLHDPKNTWQNWGWNYYKLCDCPMDRDTVLALIRQGKTFTGTLEDDFENPPTDKWPNQAVTWCNNNAVPEIPPVSEQTKGPFSKKADVPKEPEKSEDTEPDDAPPHSRPKRSFWSRFCSWFTSV